MQANTKMRRLAILLLPIVLVLLLVWLWISDTQAQTYKKLTFGETTLFVPKTFLTEDKQDLKDMVRDYLGGAMGHYQFTGYADDLLPAAIMTDDDIALTSIIWTLKKHSPEDRAGPLGVIRDDALLLAGMAPYNSRTSSFEPSTGLYRLHQTDQDTNSLIYTNIDPAAPDADLQNKAAWVARCIRLAAVRIDGKWGRCTRQFAVSDLIVQIHFDSRLIKNTTEVSSAVAATVEGWRQSPASR